MTREELQQKYIQLKMLEQQVGQVQQQLMMLDNQLDMLEKTKESIDEIKNIKQDSQVLLPIGHGVFIKGSIKDTKNMLVGIGSDIVVNKSAKESKEIVDKQSIEVTKVIKQMELQLQQLNIQAKILEEEMQQLAKEEAIE